MSISGEVIPPPRTHDSSMFAHYLCLRYTTQVHFEPGLELVPIPAISNLILMHDYEHSGSGNAQSLFACDEHVHLLTFMRHCQIVEMLTPPMCRALLVGAAGFQSVNINTLVGTAVKGMSKSFAGRVNWQLQSIKTPLSACFLLHFLKH